MRSRLQVTVAMVLGSAALLGCSEAPTSPIVDPLVRSAAWTSLGPWVVDATKWVVPSMIDRANRGKLESSINSLAGHLSANDTARIPSDIANVRSLINAASLAEYIELGPIEVALCAIERVMGL